ncbi:tyrosine-type recombinase/integrase [Brevibacillus brevis]|uniref:tyrosine-type recombinase/integrase n=1 Tax=Brevibacillus brevis TaxID=1393 RepID=UPI0007D8C5DA|nr:tyrosine-type recombinase/integrase [Brevibacillus brevis]WGV57748.1 tyrosine-type recombinase/integrase [Brevibacillus brevis]
MQVKKTEINSKNLYCLLDESGTPISEVLEFMTYMQARGYSPNTLQAYAYDLKYLFTFFKRKNLSINTFTTSKSLSFLEYLRKVPGRTTIDGQLLLSPFSINRVLSAVSMFYEYLLLTTEADSIENPIQKTFDPTILRVSERHRPFLGLVLKQKPVRRKLRVRTYQRLPRPLSDGQVIKIIDAMKNLRDKAIFTLMLQGGLRPGEVLNLHLDDIQYGRRRVVIRYREDHPKGVRTKSRFERVVDIYEPEALTLLSSYVMKERPIEANNPHVFLVGGQGKRRFEPLGYSALIKRFNRTCQKLGIQQPGLSPHALRHTHATKMWEGGMRELTLQKRLGHASPESTRIYTRVSDSVLLDEYLRALSKAKEGAN